MTTYAVITKPDPYIPYNPALIGGYPAGYDPITGWEPPAGVAGGSTFAGSPSTPSPYGGYGSSNYTSFSGSAFSYSGGYYPFTGDPRPGGGAIWGPSGSKPGTSGKSTGEILIEQGLGFLFNWFMTKDERKRQENILKEQERYTRLKGDEQAIRNEILTSSIGDQDGRLPYVAAGMAPGGGQYGTTARPGQTSANVPTGRVGFSPILLIGIAVAGYLIWRGTK